MLTREKFEARIEVVTRAIHSMEDEAWREGRDISATIAALKRERDSVIENFYRTFEDPSPPDEPPGNAPVGARRRPTPPTRTGAGAEPFPPQNDPA
jgi:hypothetical protein